VNQFDGYQRVYAALGNAIAVALAGDAQVAAASAEANAAQAEYAQVQADVDASYNQLIGQVVGLAGQQADYNASRNAYQAQLDAAARDATNECNEQAMLTAEAAGWSFSGANDKMSIAGGADPQNGWYYGYQGASSKTWSPAAIAAQLDRCQKAKNAYELALKTLPQHQNAMQVLMKALQLQIAAANLQIDALPKRLAAAQARMEAGKARVPTAIGQRHVQVVAANMAVQNAYNQLLGTAAAIDEAYLQAEVASSRINLENSQAGYDIRTRFGLRKRFHSYDLWRARALTENARRLAVAARRAIETRYVVELSTMRSAEPFVAAPALWADDIYAPDLKPPVALGLTRSPTTASGIYTNKLDDYVNNLKLFLDGYVVERPSAAVKSDAEVMQLPGPAAQIVGSSYEADFTYIDPQSAGWSFYCPASGTWISHPNGATFSATTPTWALSTACGGKPPTLARLGFWLDPWGRLKGHIADPPFSARYNVRAGNIALNLVGSGIRDCQRAVDKAACYAEPFVRYDIEHVGPAWVTNYDQVWRTLDIPRAFIEGGKALTTEEWLDPVSNGFNRTDVVNVSRMELQGRPLGGEYQLTLELTPDVRVERIERIQVLLQTDYWVRQR
jgi:hypothetical protein